MHFKPTVSMAIVRRLIGEGCDEQQIYRALINRGIMPCVAREYAGEERRATALVARAKRRRDNRRRIGVRGTDYRRVIVSRPRPEGDGHPRIVEYHATKGWRSYRIQA